MNNHAFSIIPKRVIWYVLSFILILPGLISLFVWGLNVGIDFKGGTLVQFDFVGDRPAIEQLRTEVNASSVPGSTVQTSGDKSVLIRFPNSEGREARKDADSIKEQISKSGVQVNEASYENIGGSVASSTTKSAVTAVIITSILIIFFISWSFGSVPKPASSWRFGVTAIFALLHDLLFVIGAFSLVGHFFPQIEVDALFITALLTILGFSVNDTIVVFDRIRENLRRNPGRNFAEIANDSVNQTLARSINTSSTVLVVLIALLLLGGESIRSFILALTLGVAVGTYSSIFNAAPLLVTWQEWADRHVQPGKKK
jgi:preprotein translocase subunit SecF